MLNKIKEILLNHYKPEMIDFVKKNPDSIKELVNLAINDTQPFSWRAAWLLWSCIKNNDIRMRKYVNKIIKSIPNKKDGHQRELIKILSIMELSEKQESSIYEISMKLLIDIKKNPSVRFTALKFILKIIKKYPELKSEIQFIKQNHFLESFSPGMRNSVLKLNIFSDKT